MHEPDGTFQLSEPRLKELSDGVFSIAMTLLVLDLHLSHQGSLFHQIRQFMPRLAIYVLTFIQTGVIWIAHSYETKTVRAPTRAYFWSNLLLLMLVALLPFTVTVLAESPSDPFAVMVYGLNLVAIESSLLLYWYLARRRIGHAIHRHAWRVAIGRTLTAFVAFVAAIPLAFVDTRISMSLFVLVPVSYILPSRYDHHNADREESPIPSSEF